MLNTGLPPVVLHHHVVQHHRPSQQNALSCLVDPTARAAAYAKLHQLQQLQQQEQLCLIPCECGSPPGLLNESAHYTCVVVPSGRLSEANSPPTPPASLPSTSSSTSSANSSPSTSSKGGDVDVLKDSIRHVEELMKAPQQAQSAIQMIHTGQRISGVCEEDFVRARRIKSPCSAFAEVAEIKLIVYQLLLAPPASHQLAGIHALLQHANLNGDSSTSPLHNNNNGLNGTNGRKRSAHFGNGGGPSQPEQPVALRPACTAGVPNGGSSGFLPGWSASAPWHLLNGIRTSPTLPGNGAPTTETASAGDNKLWSSPSSVESGHKPESNAGDSNIDPVGMESDGSPTSSTCTQSPADVLAFAAAAVQNSTMNHPNGVHERKPRKQISDDYVKLIRQQHELSGKHIADIIIPVPEALECDPGFIAISEKQIVDQVVQTKKFDEMNTKDIQETTTQLCKKLAEKRVFGPRLMAQTTVAGPNHSTYNNLPDEGIIYIQHVCRTVLKDKLKSEEEFWDVFREAMRKLAARCRRVRHAKKTKSLKENGNHSLFQENGVTPLLQSENPLAFLSQSTEQWLDRVKNTAGLLEAKQENGSPVSHQQSLVEQLAHFAAQQKAASSSSSSTIVKSESPDEQPVAATPVSTPAVTMEDLTAELLNRIREQTSSAAASPVLPLHAELSAQLAKAMPSFS